MQEGRSKHRKKYDCKLIVLKPDGRPLIFPADTAARLKRLAKQDRERKRKIRGSTKVYHRETTNQYRLSVRLLRTKLINAALTIIAGSASARKMLQLIRAFAHSK